MVLSSRFASSQAEPSSRFGAIFCRTSTVLSLSLIFLLAATWCLLCFLTAIFVYVKQIWIWRQRQPDFRTSRVLFCFFQCSLSLFWTLLAVLRAYRRTLWNDDRYLEPWTGAAVTRLSNKVRHSSPYTDCISYNRAISNFPTVQASPSLLYRLSNQDDENDDETSYWPALHLIRTTPEVTRPVLLNLWG